MSETKTRTTREVAPEHEAEYEMRAREAVRLARDMILEVVYGEEMTPKRRLYLTYVAYADRVLGERQ